MVMALKAMSKGDDSCQLTMELQVKNPLECLVCPICLDFPHNCVLLLCSSYEKGCRPFVCDTNHLHSNCLDRFRSAYGMTSPSASESSSTSDISPEISKVDSRSACPLCRGEVTGWEIIEEARAYLDKKQRCCEEFQCSYTGTFLELQKHALLKHPHARPSKIDPAQQLDWENFQQSSEIIDVLSTIYSEVPRGVVLGDYVIEYEDNDTGDEFDNFTGHGSNWWTSCMFYKLFNNFRISRNRRRSRGHGTRRNRHVSTEASNSDEGSVTSVQFPESRADEFDNEYVSPPGGSSSDHSRHQR
ncbi:hypothetical protein SAY87_006776 [Trapa incisa]|uniref:Uncharacterized protein n=1 Tax=Trapa incisa TaxID=236973 RepID=A0AAN7Q029_9MYRT|nr:hypothetical protein SAY87_006776 [Trapa incisa]